jgi:hypothetical protein
MPLDVPAEGGEGRPAPRRFQYPVGWNLPMGQPGSEGLTLAAFAMLRELSRRYSTLWGMLNLRVKELVGLDWDIGPTKDAQEAAKHDKALAKDLSVRSKKLVDWFRWHIDPNYTDGFQSWFTAALWDQFIMDAVAVHPLPTRVKGKGLFGRGLAHWELLDGASIRPLVDVRGALPLPPAVAYQQVLWGVPRVDLMQVLAIGDPDETEAIMEAAGMAVDLDDVEPDGTYRMDQLHYWRQTPWTNNPYGLSPVAAALLPIAIGIQRQVWLNDYWAEGSVPSVFLEAGPQYQTSTQQKQLESSLNSLAGDIAWKHRIIVLPPGSKPFPQKDLTANKEVDLAIIEYLYPVLQIQPQEIGQMPGGKTSGLGGSGATHEMMDAMARQRTQPDRKVWKGRFDRAIQWDFGQADLEWKWLQDEEEENEEQRAAADASDIMHGLKTIDAVVVDNGGDAYGLPLTSTPFFALGSGIIPLDPSVQAPAPIVPGGAGPASPTGGSADAVEPSGQPADGSPAGPETAPQEPAGESRTDVPPDAESRPESPRSAPQEQAEPAETGKLTLADVVKGKVDFRGHLTNVVLDYLRRSYPEDVISWVKDGDWSFKRKVKLSDVNMARRPGGRDYDKVAEIAATLDRGASMDPVVLVKRLDQTEYKYDVADGFHRCLAAEKAGWDEVPALIGEGFKEHGLDAPWGTAMQDESASKKIALAEMATLRRYTRNGGNVKDFSTSVFTATEMARIATEVERNGRDVAFDALKRRIVDVAIPPSPEWLIRMKAHSGTPLASPEVAWLHKAAHSEGAF